MEHCAVISSVHPSLLAVEVVFGLLYNSVQVRRRYACAVKHNCYCVAYFHKLLVKLNS